jgi:hypothetical protein
MHLILGSHEPIPIIIIIGIYVVPYLIKPHGEKTSKFIECISIVKLIFKI